MRKDVLSLRKCSSLREIVLSGGIYYFALLLIVALVVYVKARLLGFPLERDEGAFAYMARLILEGRSLYIDGFDFKPPGLYLAYAAFMGLFGKTASGVHSALLILAPLSTLIFSLISKEMFSPITALLTTLFFATFLVSPAFLAHASHATQFVVLPLLLGLWSVIHFSRKTSALFCLLSGGCMGVTFLMKQPALIFGVFGGVVTLFSGCFSSDKRDFFTIKYGLIFTAGFLVPVVGTMIWLTQATPLDQYWFWNFQYPSQYGTVLTLEEGWRNFTIMFPNVVGNFKFMWATSLLGLLLIPFFIRKDRALLLVTFFSFFSLLAVLPGFYFRKHYFIVLIPSLALLCGVFLTVLEKWIVSGKKSDLAKVPSIIFTFFVFSSIYSERGYFFTENLTSLVHKVYGENPFSASIKVGEYIRENSVEEDKIFVFGSEPQIYLYANRDSVSPVIFSYPLVENNSFAQELQQRVIADLTKEIPEYFIYVNVPFSWSAQPDHDRKIFDWVSDYLSHNFQLEGYVDLMGRNTEYVWGAENVLTPPRSKNSILIFKRVKSQIFP